MRNVVDEPSCAAVLADMKKRLETYPERAPAPARRGL
jgi:hypothetical protein